MLFPTIAPRADSKPLKVNKAMPACFQLAILMVFLVIGESNISVSILKYCVYFVNGKSVFYVSNFANELLGNVDLWWKNIHRKTLLWFRISGLIHKPICHSRLERCDFMFCRLVSMYANLKGMVIRCRKLDYLGEITRILYKYGAFI